MLENLGDGPRKGEYQKHDRQEGKVNWEALIGVKAGSADLNLLCEAAMGTTVGTELPWHWGNSSAPTHGRGEAALHLCLSRDVPIYQFLLVLWCFPC